MNFYKIKKQRAVLIRQTECYIILQMQASIDICFYALYHFGNDLPIGFYPTLKLEGHLSVSADSYRVNDGYCE